MNTHTFDKCNNYNSIYCPHKDNEIMKKSLQTTPMYYGGKIQIQDFPPNDEINALCLKCEKFTPLRKKG
jgi:hypothetical protein